MRLLMLIALIINAQKINAWGFYAHKLINETAVYTLPKPLFGFYKLHVDYIKSHAVDADKRRYLIAEEACRHFLDGDFYERKAPIDTIPKYYKTACEKYGEDTVKQHGIVPWQIQFVMYQLTEAFKEKNSSKILKLSADLGHYVGDCHVPLHATSNYNGQKTNQVGIHGLWESRLPELYTIDYDLFTGLAIYIEKPVDSIWKAYEQSFTLVDSVLKTEKEITKKYPEDQKYSFENKGKTMLKVYSKDFCDSYHNALGNMVENRLKASIVLLGSLWYTCWVNAGQPDLENMPIIEQEKEALPDENSLEDKKMIGREE
jgi:hypothetical protein